MSFSPYVVYVDESGDHSLDKIDDNYPVFVLSFCVFEKQNYVDKVVPLFQQLKFKHFGHDLVVLHERDIVKGTGAFSGMGVAAKNAFIQDLNQVLSESPFTIISACIDKRSLRNNYTNPGNPYEISVKMCLERLYLFLKNVGGNSGPCHVAFEGRGKKEDAELELAFLRACATNATGQKIDCIPLIRPKGVNSSGLQIADLVARPIGRHVLNPEQSNRAYEILETKFHRSTRGIVSGYGLKCFP